MAISLKHLFQSAKTDGPDNTIVQPSDWNDEHVLTQATNRLLGRTTAGTGATEEIAPGTGITLSAGTLSADVTSVAGRTGAVTLSTADISGLTTGYVQKTSATGSAYLPAGTTGQREGSPSAGYIRYNTTTGKFEGYGSAWGNIGGGAAIGDTPPANPGAGDLWWNSADGRMYVYYTDANSSQWVDLSAGGAGQYLPLTGGTVTGTINLSGSLVTTDGTSTTRVLNSGGAGIIGTQSNHPLVVQHNSIERARFSSGTLALNLTPAGGVTTHTFDYDENGGQITLADASGGGNLLIDNSNGTARFYKVGTGVCEVGSSGNACKIVGNGNALVWVTNTSMSVGLGGGGAATIHAFRNGTTDYNNCGIQIQDNTGHPCLGFHAGGTTAFMLRHERGIGGLDSVNANQTAFAVFRASAFQVPSDYRIKENITPITDGIDRVKQLKPSRFNFVEGSMMWNEGRTVDGFLAHEVSPAVPEAVTGEKDAVKADGSIETQSLDQAKLVPLLTAALQEAIARIEVLEAQIKGGE